MGRTEVARAVADEGRWSIDGAMARATTLGDAFVADCDALPASARVAAFRGEERLSTSYRFDVAISVEDGDDVDMRAALGADLTLLIGANHPTMRSVRGVVAAIRLLESEPVRAVYLLSVVPELWHLHHSVHSRVYTEVTVPEIIEAVLRQAGVRRFSFRLVESYEPLEHVCQYRESDFAFVSRLMERDGLYYFFEAAGDEEQLVITDSKSSRAAGGRKLRYTRWETDSEADGFQRFACRMAALPSRVEFTDYDHLNPSLTLAGSAVVQPGGRGEVVLYGDNLRTPSAGQRRAQVRAEQLLSTQAIYEGRGNALGIAPGQVIGVEQHPVASHNGAFTVTSVRHLGRPMTGIDVVDEVLGLHDLEAREAYRVEMTGIEEGVQYRPPADTPWPRVDGVVDGIVDGEATSPYAQLDEHGRYRVKVFFDESDLVDGSASTWVRMLQPHGGGTEGFHFPLRKGTEVHLVFLGGDPDRPVIVGVAPNAHKASKVTAANHTKNIIQTGGGNRFEFEDQAGSQHVTMSTPALATKIHMGTDLGDSYNFLTTTAGNAREYVGGYQDRETVGYRTDHVTGYVEGTYDSTVSTTIFGALTEVYSSTHTRNVTGAVSFNLQSTLSEHVVGDVTRVEDATHTETIIGAATYDYQATRQTTVLGDDTLVTGGACVESHESDKTTSVAGAHFLQVAGSQVVQSMTEQVMTAPAQVFAADGDQSHQATAITIAGSESVDVVAPTVTIQADGSVTISAPSILISGGDVTMTGGNLAVSQGAVSVESGTVDVSAGLIKLN